MESLFSLLFITFGIPIGLAVLVGFFYSQLVHRFVSVPKKTPYGVIVILILFFIWFWDPDLLLSLGIANLALGLSSFLAYKFINHFPIAPKALRYGLIAVLALVGSLFIGLGLTLGVNRLGSTLKEQFYTKPFTVAAWKRHPDDRHMFADDLLRRRLLDQKTLPEVKALLGEPNLKTKFEGKDEWLYDLNGPPLQPVGGTLIIHFDNNRVDGFWASYED